ncbi:TIGR02453 family protein [Bryobacterales bacterium F-183]|nr:TIGR02453 family protein [Bryobacterales bacterium F-183]
MTAFAGFPKTGLQFLKKLRKNNTREWFEANRADYEAYVKVPREELVAALNVEIGKFAPHHVTEPKKAIYRIHRDTRFSANKSPYKTNLAMLFGRSGATSKHGAGSFYCSVSDEEVAVGGGVYMPEPEAIYVVRNKIAEDYARFHKIMTSKSLSDVMGGLQGDALKRVPKGFAADHPAAEYLRYKGWFVYRTFPSEGLADTPELVPMLVKHLKATLPLVDFLNEVLVVPKKPDPMFR